MLTRRGFLALALAPLVVGVGVRPRSGLSVSFVRRYDLVTDARPARLAVLYGWARLRPELAARVWT